jgi:hypothetical protein
LRAFDRIGRTVILCTCLAFLAFHANISLIAVLANASVIARIAILVFMSFLSFHANDLLHSRPQNPIQDRHEPNGVF